MLSSISWQQYFAAVAIISLTYYLYVILRYYQREIYNRFALKQTAQSFGQSGTLTPFEILGQAKQDQSVSIVDEQELQFAEDDSVAADEGVKAQPTIKIPSLSPQEELLKEAGKLIEAFAEVDSKAEFMSLLTVLINSYQQYSSEINYDEVNQQIINTANSQLLFEVTAGDLSK